MIAVLVALVWFFSDRKQLGCLFIENRCLIIISAVLTWIWWGGRTLTLTCHGCRLPTCWTSRPTRGRWWRPPTQWAQARHAASSHLKVAPGTEDSGPWGDGPWPPMAGEAVVVWEPRKQHCHPCWQDQANPTHCTDLASEDFRGFLEILEDSWGLSKSLRTEAAMPPWPMFLKV